MDTQINNAICDLVSDFVYYDRKEDEDLPRGYMEQLIKDGKLTIEEIVELFRTELEKSLI